MEMCNLSKTGKNRSDVVFFMGFLFIIFCASISYAINGSIVFDQTNYYPDSVAVITLYDNDSNGDPGGYDSATVSLNSTNDTTGIKVYLNETGKNTGIFNSTFTFTTSGSSNENFRILRVIIFPLVYNMFFV